MLGEQQQNDIQAHSTHTIIIKLDPVRLTPEQARAMEGLMAVARRFSTVGSIRPLNQGDVLPEPFNLDEMAVQQEAA
ncbi:hypothetical protein ACFLWA_03750 [Chloroflexota bacterium]